MAQSGELAGRREDALLQVGEVRIGACASVAFGFAAGCLAG
jgi:hypothetical protein